MQCAWRTSHRLRQPPAHTGKDRLVTGAPTSPAHVAASHSKPGSGCRASCRLTGRTFVVASPSAGHRLLAADQFAVFGHPIAHSLSPRIHHAFARQLGITLEFRAIDAAPEGFAAAVQSFFAGGFTSLDVVGGALVVEPAALAEVVVVDPASDPPLLHPAATSAEASSTAPTRRLVPVARPVVMAEHWHHRARRARRTTSGPVLA